MRLVKGVMFDPALSDPGTDLPCRLELLVDEVDLDMPTYADVDDPNFTVTHYGKFMKIFSSLTEWDEDNTELCAAQYNTISSRNKQLVPVTIATPWFTMWEVYYMRVDKVQALLRDDPRMETPGYEVLPDPTYIEQGMFGWYFQHRHRACVQCYHDDLAMGGDGKRVPKGNPLIKTHANRQVALCRTHRAEHNARFAIARK